MIDERFSADAFAARGLDTEGARELADLLATEVSREIAQVIESNLRKIVERLNAMGHNLKLKNSTPGDDSYPGDIDYRDDWEDEYGYHCKLRIGIYTVTTSGYAHFITEDEALSEKPLSVKLE